MRDGRDREPPAERGSSRSDPRRVAEGLTGRGIGDGHGHIQCRKHSDRTACFGDYEMRNAVTRHEFRGIRQPGVGADEDGGSTRASRRALILKASSFATFVRAVLGETVITPECIAFDTFVVDHFARGGVIAAITEPSGPRRCASSRFPLPLLRGTT